MFKKNLIELAEFQVRAARRPVSPARNAIYNSVYAVDNSSVNARMRIDKSGRILPPKPLRVQPGLRAGDTVELESSAEKITLRPVRTGSLTKDRGVWVFRTGRRLGPNDLDDLQRRIRDERDERNLQGGG